MNRRDTYSHISDKRYNDTLAMGNESEERFMALMRSRNNKVEKATSEQDKHQHIDVFVNDEGVDVKGNKRTDYIWLEIQNVFGGKGWLRGDAKWIAFELTDIQEFHIYKRTDLLDFVLRNVTETTDNKNEFMKFYTRKKYQGNDIVVRCNSSDINHLLIQKLSYANSKTNTN